MSYLEETLVQQVVDEKEHKFAREEDKPTSLFYLWVVCCSDQSFCEVNVRLDRPNHLMVDGCAQGGEQATLLFDFLQPVMMSDVSEAEELTLFVVETH